MKLKQGFRFVLMAVLLDCGCVTEPKAASFPEVSELSSQSTFPDPLIKSNGDKVSTREEWLEKRRPEIKALFEHYMYGAIPPKPASMKVQSLGDYTDFL